MCPRVQMSFKLVIVVKSVRTQKTDHWTAAFLSEKHKLNDSLEEFWGSLFTREQARTGIQPEPTSE